MPLVARRRKRLPISNGDASDRLRALAPQTRIVIYQGIVRQDRDIRPLAALLHEMGPPWQMVVMGRDFGFVKEIQRVCPSLIYIPYISPPEHLEITSYAFIGVLCYAFDCLNNLFCAPNKVGEYAAFGIPMLANDVPGLRLSVEASGAGVCCDFSRPEALRAGIESLTTYYDSFAHSATELYDKVRAEEAFSAIIDLAMGSRCLNECVSQ
jgi:glycosyltransferase involved in cell wall biosynthesis